MNPDRAEIDEFASVLDRFEVHDATGIEVLQAGRRLVQILNITKRRDPPKIPSSGRVCPRCHGIKLVDKGGGCLRCSDCQFEPGCNG